MNSLALADAIAYLEHEEAALRERGYQLGRGFLEAEYELKQPHADPGG